MPSKIEICNLALNRIAANTITSLQDGSQSARAAALVYDQTLAELLEKHHWAFARTRRALAPLAVSPGDLPPHWAHAFAKPADMAKFMYFEGATTGGPGMAGHGFRPDTAHEIIGDRVLANAADGIAVYTGHVTDTARFPAIFTAALTEALAARMIMPIKGDERRYGVMRDSAARVLNAAIAADLNNQDMAINPISTFEMARR